MSRASCDVEARPGQLCFTTQRPMPQPFPSSGAGCCDAALVTVSGNGQFAAYDFFPDDGSPSRIFRVAL